MTAEGPTLLRRDDELPGEACSVSDIVILVILGQTQHILGQQLGLGDKKWVSSHHRGWGHRRSLNQILFFLPCLVACGILASRPGIEPVSPAVEVRSLNHWTAREVHEPDSFGQQLQALLPPHDLPSQPVIAPNPAFSPTSPALTPNADSDN